MKRLQHMLVLLDLWRELRRIERTMDADRIAQLEREVAALRTRLAHVEGFTALVQGRGDGVEVRS